MTLKTLFAIPIAIILLVTLSLAGMLTSQGWFQQERGKAAVEAVEHMRLLLELETELRAERVVSNYALGNPYPMPDAVRERLIVARRETDLGVAAIAAMHHANDPGGTPPGGYLPDVVAKLAAVRGTIDELLAGGESARTFAVLTPMMPRMTAIARVLEDPLEQASLAVIAADLTLSGLLTEDRLAASLRDQVGLIAALLLPRLSAGQQPTIADFDRLSILLARASYLTESIGDSFKVAGSTAQIRASLSELMAIDIDGIPARLRDQASLAAAGGGVDMMSLPAQRFLVPWGERINNLRTAILTAATEHVTRRRAEREMGFDLIMVGFGAVLLSVLEAVVLLSQRVVGPLAHLGLAITRIAAGERSVPLMLHSGTREISEMVTAVETLRQAALVADAADLRQRMVARHRLELLHEALGIVQSVREPAQALERDVARLSEGIDAAIALINEITAAPPATLAAAAEVVRAGLAEIRESAADLDATFASAGEAQGEDRAPAEFVAHIQAVRLEVDRRDQVVRRFVQASLVALRDTASAQPTPVLRDLVSDQFQRIEETVATVASMRDAMTRAAAIVRELPPEDVPIAA